MRFDPQVEVVCDDCGCSDYWSPNYVYFDLSGSSGHYDIGDSAFSEWCKQNGWSEDGEKTYCEDCAREINQ